MSRRLCRRVSVCVCVCACIIRVARAAQCRTAPPRLSNNITSPESRRRAAAVAVTAEWRGPTCSPLPGSPGNLRAKFVSRCDYDWPEVAAAGKRGWRKVIKAGHGVVVTVVVAAAAAERGTADRYCVYYSVCEPSPAWPPRTHSVLRRRTLSRQLRHVAVGSGDWLLMTWTATDAESAATTTTPTTARACAVCV